MNKPTNRFRYRVLIGVVIEVDADDKADAAIQAAKVAAGLGFDFRARDAIADKVTMGVKLLDVAKVADE